MKTVERFASRLHGALIREGKHNYEQARRIWNEMIDRKPSMIARCQNTDDVVSAVNFARANGIQLSVRAGGHGGAGNAICDGGLVVDLFDGAYPRGFRNYWKANMVGSFTDEAIEGLAREFAKAKSNTPGIALEALGGRGGADGAARHGFRPPWRGLQRDHHRFVERPRRGRCES